MVNTNTITMYFFKPFLRIVGSCVVVIFNSLSAELVKWNLPVEDLDLSILVINNSNALAFVTLLLIG